MTKNSAISRTPRHSLTGFWILWVGLCTAPLLAYASPLWQNILADTPIADLIWIPILAIGWASWNLLAVPFEGPDDSELDAILGISLAAITGLALIVGPARWPTAFVFDHAGLLLWPLWILAMTWLFWGIGATRKVLGPLVYLLLVWPPVFEAIANATQTLLVTWAIRILQYSTASFGWIHAIQPFGTFNVAYGHIEFPVIVAEACSGADSLLGAAIVIPVIWFLLNGRWQHKLYLSLIALTGALVLNWIRLIAIVLAVHIIGPHFTFSYIHPVLGFVLFAMLTVVLIGLMRPFGLSMPSPQENRSIPHAGVGRLIAAILLSGLVFYLLTPLFSLAKGSFGKPQPISHNALSALIPDLRGFMSASVYHANESSILGPHSATLADMYVDTHTGHEALVEVWSAANANMLAAYGFHNCLLYHGDNIAAAQSFQLIPGIVATAYAVTLPANYVGGPRSTYVDIEWTDSVKQPDGVRYLRWSLAAFPASAPSLSSSSPIRLDPLTVSEAMVAPRTHGTWTGAIATTKTNLITMAERILHQSLQPKA
ncbi:hypothetical protein BXT84_15320 [Sulfobacillus thermotolerans]|uniref:Methanolan biosynthesis EpsI domain-containing protein n=1 Tax=Sulfobacillus thermotolerans TaxID=338644 RepID=A0ABM6RV12_9FIRM|nr:hypothetical protein BXT84_15320 [Sulfobacillus thermotolerans]